MRVLPAGFSRIANKMIFPSAIFMASLRFSPAQFIQHNLFPPSHTNHSNSTHNCALAPLL
jgi:hypothetical protein